MSTSDARSSGQLSNSEYWLIVGSLTLAVVILAASFFVPRLAWAAQSAPGWWDWLEAVLVNLGAAIALVAPIEWFSSRLRRRVERAAEDQFERVQVVRAENEARLDGDCCTDR